MEQELLQLPEQIAMQETAVSTARKVLDIARLQLRVKTAKQRLRMKASNLDSNEKTAMIITSTEDDEMELIQLEANLRAEEIQFHKLTNQFLSIRKHTNYSIAEMENL
jgi:hypothetical protein